MKIAHVSPLFVPVPPYAYGGTERVIHWLIKEQIKAGHEVTLFASGDSTTKARLIAPVKRSLWKEKDIQFPNVYHTIELDLVSKHADEFDIIHCHFNFIHFQSYFRLPIPMLTTLHWRVDIKEFQDLYRHFSNAPLVAISRAQKDFIPFANVVSIIHHGLPVEEYPYCEHCENYVTFIGRYSKVKRPHIAIEAAINAGIRIKIAASLPNEAEDKEYFRDVIRPLLSHPLVEDLGELKEQEKVELLKNALALVLPISWPEPFGLVFIESLACGTPVITCPYGAAPEIIRDNITGYLVHNTQEITKAIRKTRQIKRSECRSHAERYFSSSIMAKKYEETYFSIINKKAPRPKAGGFCTPTSAST